jgi:2-(1,2-epoxy-1,2-dihydrophenyl)acetyl-CoA isomerase
MAYTQIAYEARGVGARRTLIRAGKLNAGTRQMSVELVDAITNANEDHQIGAIVVTGAGRGFCAGADIGSQFKAQLDGGRPEGAGEGGDRTATDWVPFCRQAKPLVAAINGAAIGVGLTMVLPFDQLVAAEDAKLSCRFIKMGLAPELASSHFLIQRCGWGAASDLALSGRMISGTEAAAIGLVDRAVPAGEVLEVAMGLAREYAANPDPQLLMIKQLLTENGSETDLGLVQRREIAALNAAYKTPEHREAVDAFLEKRAPKFR